MDRNEILDLLPKNKICVELGVFVGDYSKVIYARMLPSKLYLVDTFPRYMVSGDKDGKNIRRRNLTRVAEKLRKFFDDRVEVVVSTSKDFLETMLQRNEKVDFIYVDARHEYKDVLSDLELGWDLLNPDGWIAGHDYEKFEFPAVFNAVTDFCRIKDVRIEMLSDDELPSYFIRKV
jgi:hypothetical protein